MKFYNSYYHFGKVKGDYSSGTTAVMIPYFGLNREITLGNRDTFFPEKETTIKTKNQIDTP